MTSTSADLTAPADLRLGRDVVRRMRLPGPPLGTPLPSRIGSLASSISRFAASTSRPVDVRRALIGPGPHGLAGSSAPPRWWTPVASEAAGDSPAPTTEPVPSGARRAGADTPATPPWLAPARPVALRRLPERGLPRAAREVPDESNRTPGGILGGLRGEVARVRRLEEVVAVGPMLTQTDRAKLNAGLAARSAQQATAQQATSQPSVARRATTRTPRQPASPASAPSVSEPPTVPSDPSVTAAPSPPAAGSPGGGASATVAAAGSVAQTPPAGSTPSTSAATAPGVLGGGASATVSAAGSVAQPPPAGAAAAGGPSSAPSVAAPAGAPIRRVARPSWQLRSQQSRFDGLVRRTPTGHTGSAGSPTTPASVGLSSVVSRLATPGRLRPATTSAGPSGSLESSVRGPELVAAAGPGLIAGGVDAPATVRRHAWSAGSLVMRQAAGARTEAGLLAASRPTARTTTTTAATPDAASGAAPGAATIPMRSAPATTTTPATASAAAAASKPPAGRSADPVVRRLPSAVGSTPVTGAVAGSAAPPSQSAHATHSADSADSADSAQSSGAQATVPSLPSQVSVADTPPTGTGPASAEGSAPADVRRLPRLWRRATDIRPAMDVRTSVPAPVVRLASDPVAPASSPAVRRLPAASAPITSTPAAATAAPASPPASPGSPASPAPSPSTSPTSPTTPPASTPTPATATAPAAAATTSTTPTAVRRSAFPASRVGAHVASPGIAGADLGMPELMTIRRATAHGTDANRTLATGFGAPETIRPAGSPVAAPAALGGETRLWRRTITPSGATRSSSAPASPAAMAGTISAPGGGFAAGFATGRAAAGVAPGLAPGATPRFAGTDPAARAASPVRRTWQPWNDAPAAAGTAQGTAQGTAPITSFPAGPPGTASAPTGRRPAPDVRRMTVAPPRISVAPSQPPPPPVPEVGRTPGTTPPATPGSATVRRSTGGSLVDATAHLFASPDSSVVRRTLDPGGAPMSTFSQPAAPPPPSAAGNLPVPMSPAQSQLMAGGSAEFGNIGGQPDQEPPGVAFDTLVDAVVQRIERRVVEELERRGRRTGRGQF